MLPFPADGPGARRRWRAARRTGPLLGGNLSLLSATLGTPYAIQPEGAILFIEEVGEQPYRLDRMLSHLKLAGVLDAVAGHRGRRHHRVAGRGRRRAYRARVLHDRLGGLGVPVATGFPFGHIDDNWTLPMGVRARLDADAGTLELLEPAVS